jgi:TDG/mug DNA glycosylase family protein
MQTKPKSTDRQHRDKPADLKQAFGPILGPSPRLLILGSMPGEASLRIGQYYGHPRNAFWPIMSALLDLPAQADYATRCAALKARGIALWDVIGSCARSGSLDSAIRPETVRVNDIALLLRTEPTIGAIFCNGGTAEREFTRRVWPSVDPNHRDLPRLRLPSTSPAYAGMPFADKLAAWRVILPYCRPPPDRHRGI